MNVAIISDTHIPSRASAIPPSFVERIEVADHVIHAGDVDSPEALATVRDMAPDLTIVAGNMDGGMDLPTVETVELGGVTFVVTHNTGPPAGYEQRLIEAVQQRDADVGVAGHSHDVLDRERHGVRLLNPGSATGAFPAPTATMMTAEVEDGEIDVALHEA